MPVCDTFSENPPGLNVSIRKTPVFVNSVETAVELSTSFGSDRSDLLLMTP